MSFTCPFCGLIGRKSKEHVWAQWLHEMPGAKSLLEGTHGERIVRTFRVVTRDEEGRYQGAESSVRSAIWLPHFTVAVCEACNGGWMSGLETDTKAVLEPFLFEGMSLQLSTDDLRVLTTWATKSWMAYALGRAPQTNPFTEAEYRAMAVSPAPLRRSRVWLMHADDHVGMAIASTLIAPMESPPDLTSSDNTAYAYLAAGSVVMIMALAPDGAPDEVLDLLTPPIATSPSVRRCWPDLEPQDFPVGLVSSVELGAFRAYPPQFFAAIGLPVEDGLTEAGAEALLQQFREGKSPLDLRGQGDV